MREIKFRAWHNVDWVMYYNHSVCLTIDGVVTYLDKSGIWQEDEDKSIITLMQFTGLKDKNGKEIYEGDIISYDQHYTTDKLINLKVEWDNNNCFYRGYYGKDTGHSLNNFASKHYEVIGNIYETPELIA